MYYFVDGTDNWFQKRLKIPKGYLWPAAFNRRTDSQKTTDLTTRTPQKPWYIEIRCSGKTDIRLYVFTNPLQIWL